MNETVTSLRVTIRMWLLSSLALSAGIFIYCLYIRDDFASLILPGSFIVSAIGSIPAFFVVFLFLPIIKRLFKTYTIRAGVLVAAFFFIALVYGATGGFFIDNPFSKYGSLHSFFISAAICTTSVFAAVMVAFFINLNYFKIYFLSSHKKINQMQEHINLPVAQSNSNANKVWIKALITGALILIMLIPTVFVSNLVEERQQRQEQVKKEVSSKWAGEQGITFPYLFIPYTISETQPSGKILTVKKSFIILPENLNVSGSVVTQQRQRSIYTVLLYSSKLNAKGNFNIQLPNDVDVSTIDWANAKICFGISDFKGIEQKISVKLNNQSYELSAGLPTTVIDTTGLSSLITLSADDIDKSFSFEMPLKIKGSDDLHFVPLAGNSQFTLTSPWNSPSFDGNTLPAERNLNNNGFEANWNFNKANLPFNTVFKDFNFKKNDYSFGVSLLQPADQYAKTLRCVKYAILFIGLTFSFFFIIEIMQKKPFHPVQYILVGLALIVFYTLLLSVSEFLLFDVAYLIASVATVLLITLYAKSHFKSWKIAGAFAGVIGAVYDFIFVLIRLEDTALLVGSIGLFIILAIAMYASRKVNWYGTSLNESLPYKIE
jgi:inner membrane protein